jgi:hypothetical protein
MQKNSPTDIIVKDNVLRLLWAFYMRNKGDRRFTGYSLAKEVKMDQSLIYRYLKRWAREGLLIIGEETDETVYYSLNTDVIKIVEGVGLLFCVNGLQITLTESEKKK